MALVMTYDDMKTWSYVFHRFCLVSLSYFVGSSNVRPIMVGLDMWIYQVYPYYYEIKALPNLNHCDVLSIPANTMCVSDI